MSKNNTVQVVIIYKLKPHLTRGDNSVWFGHCYTTQDGMSPFFIPIDFSEKSMEEHCIVHNTVTGGTDYYTRDRFGGHFFTKATFDRKVFEGTGFVITNQLIASEYYTTIFEQKINEFCTFGDYTSFVRFDYNKFEPDEIVKICLELA